MSGLAMWALPGYNTLQSTFENEILWGSDMAKLDALWTPANIASTTTDAGNTPTTLLRPGLVMAQVGSTNLWTHYLKTGTGGQQIARGVLTEEVRMTDFGGTAIQKSYRVLVRGPIRNGRLYGLDYQARMQLSKMGFKFDDFVPNYELPFLAEVELADAVYTVTAAESGTLYTMTPTASRAITLPAIAPGMLFTFLNLATGFPMVITSAEGTNIVCGNNASASNISCATASQMAGSLIRVFSNGLGTKWIASQLGFPANTTTGFTSTVA